MIVYVCRALSQICIDIPNYTHTRARAHTHTHTHTHIYIYIYILLLLLLLLYILYRFIGLVTNSPWQRWSCGLVHCPGGNATEPIWRVLASSDRISSWTLLKPQHSNPNPNRLANQLCCIDFLTPPTPFIIPQRFPAFLESLMSLKNWCSIHARWSKSSLKYSIGFCGNFSKF